MNSWVAQLRKGLVELCVMAAVRGREAYGYEILQRLGKSKALAISESTVYPILARLAQDGMVKVRVEPSPAGPARRYYRLTPAGEARLDEMTDHWKQVSAAIEALFRAAALAAEK